MSLSLTWKYNFDKFTIVLSIMSECASHNIAAFACACALALSVLTATKSLYCLREGVTTRKSFLTVGILLNLTASCINSHYYFETESRNGLGMISLLFLNYISNVCLLTASCKRYFVFLPEKNRRIAELSLRIIVCVF
jgi:hypothetical protein